MVRVSSTIKTENAAFSKSVSCTSHGRNSTRQPEQAQGERKNVGGGFVRQQDKRKHDNASSTTTIFSSPMSESAGGGLNRIVCQFVL